MDKNAPSMLKSTMIGGLALGVAGGIPVVNFLNCACCALVIAGGFLAAFLYSKECKAVGAPFGAGPGALVGLVAGLFYAVASTVLTGLFQAIRPTSPEDIDQMIEMLEQFDLPPEAVDGAAQFMQSSTGLVGLLIGFFITLLIAAVFSTLGGLIGGAVFKNEPMPPASSATPPPASPGV